MQELSTNNNFKFSILNNTDKLIVITIPTERKEYVSRADLQNLANTIRKNCGCKVLFANNHINFKGMNLDQAINYIDDNIEALYKLREELLEDD